MNKHELIEVLSLRCGLNMQETKELFDATFSVLTESLSKNQRVSISDFGTFESHARKPHRYFDLFRKRIMMAPKKIAILFHPAADLKNRLHEISVDL